MNMLKAKRMFDIVEETLKNNGELSEFEKEYGKIKGRMMITIGEIPDELGVTIEGDKKPTAFEASFDFYDSIIGFALYTDTNSEDFSQRVFYTLKLYIYSNNDIVEMVGIFYEVGMTGMRDSICYSLARKAGLAGEQMEGWEEYPYDT